ncbi:MAG TPA: hypothetical protein VGL40_07875 [Bacillota bacterium]
MFGPEFTFKQAKVDFPAAVGELSQRKSDEILSQIGDEFSEIIPAPVVGMLARRSKRLNSIAVFSPAQVSLLKVGASGLCLLEDIPWIQKAMEKCLVETVNGMVYSWVATAKGKEPAATVLSPMLGDRGRVLAFKGVEAIGFHMFVRSEPWVGDFRIEPLAEDKNLFFISLELKRIDPCRVAQAVECLKSAVDLFDKELRALLVSLGVETH